MKLEELLTGVDATSISGPTDVEITHVAYDSRKVGRGGLFVCVSGLHTDGHKFAKNAISAGAVAVATDKDVPVEGAVGIRVPDARIALALFSCNFFGHPSRGLKLAGITGTNGKTTISYMVQSVCSEAGIRAGVIGTIGYDLGSVKLKGSHTTPEAPEFQELMSRMVHEGMTHAAVEVSSHALALRRSYGTEFDVVVFTNLSRDHLDFHATFEEYKQAKLRLFSRSERGATIKQNPAAIINLDDPCFNEFAKAAGDNVCSYSITRDADVKGCDIELLPHGSTFSILSRGRRFRVKLAVPGIFNVMNGLAAFGAGVALGFDEHQTILGLQALEGVRGRLERVDGGQDFSVFIDYAHTPDALSNILKTVRQITKGKLICVFGCGGDRDRGKRSEMGSVAGTLADHTIITSDNPRSEEPLSIMAQIEEGSRRVNAEYSVIPDRGEAIGKAIARARPGDSVVIAGKGHEDYQIVGSETRHFDDREVAEGFLSSAKRSSCPPRN